MHEDIQWELLGNSISLTGHKRFLQDSHFHQTETNTTGLDATLHLSQYAIVAHSHSCTGGFDSAGKEMKSLKKTF